MGGSESMTINPAVDVSESIPHKDGMDVEDGLHKELKIVRQVSDVSTAPPQSPAYASLGAPPCEQDPCHSIPFHSLESMDEVGSSEQLSEEAEEEEVEPLWQGCREAPRLCAGLPPLQSELGRWAQWAVAAEEWQSFVKPMGFEEWQSSLAPLAEDGDADWSADESSEASDEAEAEGAPCTLASPPPLWQDCREPARICLGMPPLQSDLGKWAQWAVAAEEWQSAVLGEPVEYPCNVEGSDLSSSDEE
jgi:hypothetical protein